MIIPQKKTLRCLPALASLSFMSISQAQETQFPPPKILVDAAQAGKNIQRTMTLLASSTPQKRNTVKILFYGQSITEGSWWKAVEADLRRRFPDANLIVENRALGGFSSQLLVHAAEADLYGFYPDLLIFHVYGSHVDYEKIIQRTRERTTAEILIQNDHLSREQNPDENTDPAQIKDFRPWEGFFNFVFLPDMAQKYQAALLDQRALWKRYLKDYNLTPGDLLNDGVHPNARGNYLMAQGVNSYLVRRADETIDPHNSDTVKTLVVGKDIFWQGDKLIVPFNGNRIDAIAKAGATGRSPVLIDGKKPSQIRETYGFTQALSTPGGKWPVILKIGSQALPQMEEWTLDVQKDAAHEGQFAFSLQGSKTGADGQGNSRERFVSKSGRVVIEPTDWNVKYSLDLPGIKPVPDKFTVKWRDVAHFVDEWAPPENKEPNTENVVTLAQGLKNGAHTLEISGAQDSIAALRVYRPLLNRETPQSK
jgi:hypothetical protein